MTTREDAAARTAWPPLDKEAVREALASAVRGEAVGALLRVSGEDGHWEATAGSAGLDTDRPVDAGGHFRIGSVTKPLLATVTLQLVQEGALGLDDPVGPLLPGVLPGDYPPLTVRQLLGHTSGVPNYLPLVLTAEKPLAAQRDRTWTVQELLDVAFRQPRPFEPGAGFGYSNTNYLLLCLLIRRLTGRDWHEEVARRVTGPLGMAATREPGTNPHLPSPHARGYTRTDGELVDITEINPSVYHGAGSMISTARDLDIFLDALLAGRLVRPPLLEQMLTPGAGTVAELPVFGYGLGTQRLDLSGEGSGPYVYGSGGGLQGYITLMFGTRDGRRRLVASLTLATDNELSPLPTLMRLARAVFLGAEAAGQQPGPVPS
ncbi:serine hydrolase [Streptomyces sp. 7-21]|uniref:serine hydrolase domain-containing protein n=1 Tax=Streptomyces sp. 7-21 TaxID=2802283 RepID=UPI00191FB200|nr:serine hydrolase domain-containing protein [Streptomyces sp. 7-21]MBL1069024.1 beta-lactamase family protein [Streptomyces sp. 7-21]